MNVIETRSLDKVFPGGRRRPPVKAVEDLDLDVPAGTVFGLLGLNGAGKTTLVKILLGLVRISQGQARVLGRPVSDHRVRARIGFLPEGQSYPDYLSGLQYVRYMGRLSGLRGRDLHERSVRRLEQTGLAEAMERKIRTYSKGMCQRTGLAAALVHDPELVFLDEPTDGVDPRGRKEIRELMVEIGSQGHTVFLNSHLLAEVDQVCQHVGILHRGRLIACDRTEEVKRRALGLSGDDRVAYEIESTGEDLGPVLADLARPEDPRPAGARATVFVAPGSGVTPVIDRIRAAGIGIRAVIPKGSLEDRFLELVEADDRMRAAEANAATGRDEEPSP